MFNRLAAVTIAATILISTPAYAGQWLQDSNGWWWQNDDGSYPTERWMWLDGNNDGMSEHYYFGSDGYVLTNTITPDEQQVNGDGAWVIDGTVQTAEAEWVERNTAAIPMTEEEYEQFVDHVNGMKTGDTSQREDNKNMNRDIEDSIKQTTYDHIDFTELSYRITELINEERENEGKRVMFINNELMENALLRAEEASEYFSHTRPNGKKYSTVITTDFQSAGENLAVSTFAPDTNMEEIAAHAVSMWLNSSQHKQNLLKSQWTETGVGAFVGDDGSVYFSQIFVQK